MADKNIGKVAQVIGPVLDVRFEGGNLPNLLNAIEIDCDGRKITAEVAQHVGDNVVRCIAMSSTDGLRRGVDAGAGQRFAGGHQPHQRTAGEGRRGRYTQGIGHLAVRQCHLADGQMAVDARQMAHGADATAVRAQGTERGIASCTKGRDDAHARDINRWGHAVGKGKRGKKVERQGVIISCDGP